MVVHEVVSSNPCSLYRILDGCYVRNEISWIMSSNLNYTLSIDNFAFWRFNIWHRYEKKQKLLTVGNCLNNSSSLGFNGWRRRWRHWNTFEEKTLSKYESIKYIWKSFDSLNLFTFCTKYLIIDSQRLKIQGRLRDVFPENLGCGFMILWKI